jgi:hypothetical protein
MKFMLDLSLTIFNILYYFMRGEFMMLTIKSKGHKGTLQMFDFKKELSLLINNKLR